MKNNIKKFLSAFLTIVFVFSFEATAVKASSLPRVEIRLQKTDSGNTLGIYITDPYELASIDLNVLFPESMELSENDVSFFNAGNDNSSNPIFLSQHSVSGNAVCYSACFLNTSKESGEILLCEVSLDTLDGSEKSLVTIKYNLQTDCLSDTNLFVFDLKQEKTVYTNETGYYYLGDINGDGDIKADDARTALRYSVGLEKLSPDRLPYANANYDNSITAADARIILRTAVGLEEKQLRSYKVSISVGESCETAEEYRFTCSLSGEEFTLASSIPQHVYCESTCYQAEKCIICNSIISPAKNHVFENGYCTLCSADENVINTTKDKLTPLLEDVNTYDVLASQAAKNNDIAKYIDYVKESTLIIKKALDLCDNVHGFETTAKNLESAYSLRFEAFVKCTDANGRITSNRRTYNYISSAVNASTQYLDYASNSIS